MNRQEMLALLAQGESPIDVSIKKWQDIVDACASSLPYQEMGADNCALCETTKAKWNCADCPYMMYYGHSCLNAAFSDFYVARNKSERLRAAQAMVEELEAIKNAQKDN